MEDDTANGVEVKRYDRLQARYLTTGDFSALQQMNTNYPMETRTLVEDVLQLGEVNDPEINTIRIPCCRPSSWMWSRSMPTWTTSIRN